MRWRVARVMAAATMTDMEAAFFDLDKTVIARSSVLAFGWPLYREGLLPRAALIKSVYGVFVAVGLGLAGWRWLRQRPAA